MSEHLAGNLSTLLETEYRFLVRFPNLRNSVFGFASFFSFFPITAPSQSPHILSYSTIRFTLYALRRLMFNIP